MYTEQDIQDYLDGNFKGDLQAFENYVQHNPEAQQLLKYYRMLYASLKEENEMSLSFSLQDAVIAKALHKKESRLPGYKLLNSLTGLTAMVVIIFCWKIFAINSLFKNIEPVYLVALPLLCVFILAWHSVELAARRKKYQFLQE